jgi:NitT/TauT family transport system substrate-binding protein
MVILRKAFFWPVLLALLSIAGAACQPGTEREPKAPLKLSLAFQPAIYSGLIAIAQERGYFRECGLEVAFQQFSAGTSALESLCRGESQLSTITDIAVAPRIIEGQPIRVVASIGVVVGTYIVGRKDRNIHEISDLRGKKIGFIPHASSEYFLDSFLLRNNISQSEITYVPLQAEQQVEALGNGEVDAISAFEPYAFNAAESLGENAVSWESDNLLGYQWLLVASEELTQSPEALDRFLKALIKAEKFRNENQDESRNIIMRVFGVSPKLMELSWDRTRAGVSLNQSVINSIQNFVLWRMQKDGVTGEPPMVTNFIYTGALDRIDPKRVTIFR